MSLAIPFSVVGESRYNIKEGDTLSQLAHEKIGSPIYGTKGSLNKILTLNQEVKNPDEIKIGQIIVLGEQNKPKLVNENLPLEIKTQSKVDQKQLGQKAHSYFNIALGLDSFKVEGISLSKSGEAQVNSKLSPRVDLAFGIHIDETKDIYIRGAFQHYILNSLDGGANYQSNDSGLRSGLALGYSQRFSLLTLGAEILGQEELFLRAVSSTVLGVDRIIIYEPRALLNLRLFQSPGVEIGLKGAYAFLLPNSNENEKISSGNGYEAGIYFRNYLINDRQGLQGEVVYQTQNQNSNLFTRKFTESKWSVSYYRMFN